LCAGGARLIVAGVLEVGDVAPDFAVGGGRLSSLLERGGAIVFFFPKAFTPG
jgi:peroxiredoxin